MGSIVSLLSAGLLASAPTSTNYTLKSYDFGNGGGTSSSTNYQVNGLAGSQGGGDTINSTNNTVVGGLQATQNTNVPQAPTLVNPANNYNRLRLTLNTSGNPSDTRYLIAISPDAFVSTTSYVQTDNAIGTNLSIANYQTYAAWGGASGFLILGLEPATTYTVKVKAIQGKFSESGFSPTASAATVQTSITFSVATSATSIPPFNIGFSGLAPGVVQAADEDALLGLSSNALNGGSIYVQGQNNGLTSLLASYTITSATANLASALSGYGAQVISVSQTSGGPLAAVAPFNGAVDNVGILSNSPSPFTTTSGPISNASSTLRLKAKTESTVPSANDYSDTLTFIAAMDF